MLRISLNIRDILNQIDKIIVFVFLFTTAYVRIIDNNSLLLVVCSLCLSISGFYNIAKIIYYKELNIIIVIGLYVVFWVIEFLGRPTWHYDVRFLISSLCYLGIAYSFMTNERKTKPYLLLYYGITLFILVQILVFRVPYYAIMKEGSSYNYISILMLFYLLLLNYLETKENKEISYLPGILFLAVSILSYGRGGMVTAIIYNIILLAAKGIKHKRKIKTYIIGSIIVCVLIVVGKIVIDKLLTQGYLNKFIYYGMDNNGRAAIWAQFFETCKQSLWDFLMGGNPRVLDYIDNNVHNSFLQLYASFGFVLFMIIMILLFSRIIKYCICKDLWMLVIVMTFIIRAMTDKIMYRGYHEILFYIFLFENHIKYCIHSGSTVEIIDM